MLVGLEAAFNVFPSTPWSSALLQVLLLLVVVRVSCIFKENVIVECECEY